MNEETIGRVSWAWAVVAIALGIGLVTLPAPVVTTVGVIVLIFGILGLMPALRFTWLAES